MWKTLYTFSRWNLSKGGNAVEVKIYLSIPVMGALKTDKNSFTAQGHTVGECLENLNPSLPGISDILNKLPTTKIFLGIVNVTHVGLDARTYNGCEIILY